MILNLLEFNKGIALRHIIQLSLIKIILCLKIILNVAALRVNAIIEGFLALLIKLRQAKKDKFLVHQKLKN